MPPDVRVISQSIFSELSPLFGIRILLLPVVLTCILALSNHLAAAQNQPPSAQSDTKVSYFRQIRPVLQRHCQGCHQPASKQADLLLTSYEGFRSGGKSGPSFLAGKPDQSLVLAYMKGDRQPRMPLGGEPLPGRADRCCFDAGLQREELTIPRKRPARNWWPARQPRIRWPH